MASNAPEGGYGNTGTPARAPSRSRLIIALTLLAFVGGLGAMAWAISRWQGGLHFRNSLQDPATVATATGDNSAGGTPAAGAPPAAAPVTGLTGAPNEANVADLEQRMARIAVSAASASGYANRAEAMMIAFAARRSLDAGMPLGYIESQLRLLFGDAQPKAVATIVNASAQPVTLSTLRAGLDTIRAAAIQGAPAEGWWAGMMRELRGLAVIHKAGAPAPEPEQRIARARLAVESGQIDAAMDEITALPRMPETTEWLELARRYNEAHRALDVIEAAAILEPRAAPIVSPVAPVDRAAVPAPASNSALAVPGR